MSDPDAQRRRVQSVDLIRGIVLVLMALDHVRVYSGVSAGGASAAVFFTRWVTHFCAPAFLFLAGTSIYLSNLRAPADARPSRQLVIRGLWLILLELTFIRFAWTFNFGHGENLLAGVIWAIGWSMILMAGLIRLPRPAILAFALLILVGHNLVGELFVQESPWQSHYHWLFRVIYAGGWIELGETGPELDVLYSIVPWVGVMAAGYWFGPILLAEAKPRDRLCLLTGLAMIAAFVVLRVTSLYGDPRSWPEDYDWLPAWLAFFSPQKYPASLQFLLMTLGPMLVAVPMFERAAGRVSDTLRAIGRVPMFFYLLHIPLIHLLAVGIAAVRTPEALPWLFEDHPLLAPPAPDGYVYGLGLLYATWLAVVLLLVIPCRRYAALRPKLPKRLRDLI